MKLAEYLVQVGYCGFVLITILHIITSQVDKYEIMYCGFLMTLAIGCFILRKNYYAMKYFYFMIAALLVNHFYGKGIDISDIKGISVHICEIAVISGLLYLALVSLNQRKEKMDNNGTNLISTVLIISAIALCIQLLQIIFLYHFSFPIIILIITILLISNLVSLRTRYLHKFFIIAYCLYSILSVRTFEMLYNSIFLDTVYRQTYNHFFEFSQLGCNGYYIIDDLLTYEYLNIFLSVLLFSLSVGKNRTDIDIKAV